MPEKEKNEVATKLGLGRLEKITDQLEALRGRRSDYNDEDPLDKAIMDLTKAETIKALKSGDTSPIAEVEKVTGLSFRDILAQGDERAKKAEGRYEDLRYQNLEREITGLNSAMVSLANSVKAMAEGGGGGGSRPDYLKEFEQRAFGRLGDEIEGKGEASSALKEVISRLDKLADEVKDIRGDGGDPLGRYDLALENVEGLKTRIGQLFPTAPAGETAEDRRVRLEDERERLKIRKEDDRERDKWKFLDGLRGDISALGQLTGRGIVDGVMGAMRGQPEGAQGAGSQQTPRPEPTFSREFEIAAPMDQATEEICPACLTQGRRSFIGVPADAQQATCAVCATTMRVRRFVASE